MIDIENTQARLLVGPMLASAAEIRFLPGMNHVDEKLWEETKLNKNVQTWLNPRLGWLIEHGGTPAPQEVDAGLTFEDIMVEASKMPANELVSTIEHMDLGHRDVLVALAERDNRASVSLAAKLRLDALEPTIVKKSE